MIDTINISAYADDALKVLVDGIKSLAYRTVPNPDNSVDRLVLKITKYEMMMMEAEALESASELIRDGIKRHVAKLRQERNELVPYIHTLPPELLSEIFDFTIHSQSGVCRTMNHERRGNSEYPFILAKVCSRWYNVANSTPRVWSVLCNKLSINQTQMFLARSGGSPLHISCHAGDNRQFLSLVFEQIHRCQAVFLVSDGILELAKELLGMANAPLLETFEVFTTTVRGGNLPSLRLFNDNAPRLWRLDLSPQCSFTVPWHSNILVQLRWIRIRDLDDEEEGIPVGAKYHHLFKSLPILAAAYIYGNSRRDHSGSDDATVGRFETISHSTLQLLDLEDLPASLILTIASFISPKNTFRPFMHVRGSKWGSLDAQTPISLPRDNYIASMVNNLKLIQIFLPVSLNRRIKICGKISTKSMGYFRTDLAIHDDKHELQLNFTSGILRPLPLLFSALLPLQATYIFLRSLQLSGRQTCPLSDAGLPQRLQSLPALEELLLEDFDRRNSSMALCDIFKYLAMPQEINLGSEPVWLCLGLRKIDLRKLAFTVTDLLDMLKSRHMLEPGSESLVTSTGVALLESLILHDCCTVSNAAVSAEAVNICDRTSTPLEESSTLFKSEPCSCSSFDDPHLVIRKTDLVS